MARMTPTRIDWISLSNWRNASAAPSRISRPPPLISSSTISLIGRPASRACARSTERTHGGFQGFARSPAGVGHPLDGSHEPVFCHEPPVLPTPITVSRRRSRDGAEKPRHRAVSESSPVRSGLQERATMPVPQWRSPGAALGYFH